MRQAGRWFGSAAWEPLVYIVPFLLYRIVEHAKIRILFEFISLNGVKFRKKNKKLPENLADSEKVCTFAPAFDKTEVGAKQKCSGFSAVGSAHVWGARGRWFESSNPDRSEGVENKWVSAPFLFPKFQSILARVTEIVTKTITVMNAKFWITIYKKFLEVYLLHDERLSFVNCRHAVILKTNDIRHS